MTNPVSLSRFEAIVAAYGADPRRWPEEERDQALLLLRADSRAEVSLEQAGMVDTLFARYVVPEPSITLRHAVIAGVRAGRLRHRIKLAWAALALALAGGGGVLAGTTAAMMALPGGGMLSIWDGGDTTAFGDLLAADN